MVKAMMNKDDLIATEWDSSQYWETEEDMILYLQACIDEAGDNPAFIAKALGNIAKARGMSQLAKETGLGRESLYKSLSGEVNPSFETILKIMKALNLKITIQPA